MQKLKKCCNETPKICYVCGDYFVMCRVCGRIGEEAAGEEDATKYWNKQNGKKKNKTEK